MTISSAEATTLVERERSGSRMTTSCHRRLQTWKMTRAKAERRPAVRRRWDGGRKGVWFGEGEEGKDEHVHMTLISSSDSGDEFADGDDDSLRCQQAIAVARPVAGGREGGKRPGTEGGRGERGRRGRSLGRRYRRSDGGRM